MTTLVILMVVLVGLVAVGLAAVLERTPDTRDPEFGVGSLLAPSGDRR